MPQTSTHFKLTLCLSEGCDQARKSSPPILTPAHPPLLKTPHLLHAIKVLDRVADLVLAVRLDGGGGLNVAALHQDARRGGCRARGRQRDGASVASGGSWSQQRRLVAAAAARPRPSSGARSAPHVADRDRAGAGKGHRRAGGGRTTPPHRAISDRGPRLSRLPSATVSTGRRATSARCWGAGRNAGAAAYACFAERAVLQLCMFRNARMDRGVSFGMPCKRDRAIQPRCNLGLPMHRFCASWRSLLLIGCVTQTLDTRDPGGRDPAGSPGGGGGGGGARDRRGTACTQTNRRTVWACKCGYVDEREGFSAVGGKQATVNERRDRRLTAGPAIGPAEGCSATNQGLP